MKKLIKLIYLVFTAFFFACTNIENKEQINRATAVNTEFTINDEEKTAEELGFNTDLEKAQEITKGKWIRDGINDATYNIGVTELNTDIIRDTQMHLLDRVGDVALWENHGVGSRDKLKEEQRKLINIVGTAYATNKRFQSYINKNKIQEVNGEIYYKFLKEITEYGGIK